MGHRWYCCRAKCRGRGSREWAAALSPKAWALSLSFPMCVCVCVCACVFFCHISERRTRIVRPNHFLSLPSFRHPYPFQQPPHSHPNTKNPIMPNPRLLITFPMLPEMQPKLQALTQVQLEQMPEEESGCRESLLKRIRGCAGLICSTNLQIDKELLQAGGPSLKVISTKSVGYNHIDLSACREQGIQVGYTPDIVTDATADTTAILTIMTARGMGDALASVKDGRVRSFLSFFCPYHHCTHQPSCPSSLSSSSHIFGSGDHGMLMGTWVCNSQVKPLGSSV